MGHQRATAVRPPQPTTARQGAVRRAGRPAARRPIRMQRAPMVADDVLQLQALAGNRAVAGLLRPAAVQRAGGAPPAVTTAAAKPLADLDAMTLSAFHGYAEAQADWSTNPLITAVQRRQLWTLLEWARGKPAVMTGCGDMPVAGLRVPAAAATTRRDLEHYSDGVERQGTVIEVPATIDVPRARSWGAAMARLYGVPGPAVAKKGIKQESEAADVMTGQLELLVAKSYVGSFIAYHQAAQPFWESPADTESYLRQREEDSADPRSFVGAIPDLRNPHRFEAALLRAARSNLADRSRRRPLALVLHTSHDHNGAFMRDPNLTAAFERASHVTLMIEGAASLAAIEGRLPALARTYGRGRKITEVMVAGHGGPRGMELAGTPAAPDNLTLDADPGAAVPGARVAATEQFFNRLLDNMEESPDARIVLNACLTAANVVDRPLDPADPGQAKTDINAAIAANPSLATRVQQIATARGLATGVRGASGSFSSEATLLDSSGRLDIVSGLDPHLTDPDKFTYVRHGHDPEGALRATLECWAQDKARTLTLVRERRDELRGQAGVPAAVVHTLYSIVLDNPDNAQLINQLASAATPLDHLASTDESEPGEWAGADTLKRYVPVAHQARIFPPVVTAATTGGNHVARLVAATAHAAAVPAQRDAFLDAVAAYGCRDIDKFVPPRMLSGHLAVPDLLASAGNEAGRVRIAVVTVRGNRPGTDEAKTFLQGKLGAATAFPAASGVAPAIAGYWNEPALLAAIDRSPADAAAAAAAAAAGGGPAPAPTPNVDLDEDGTNDFYIVPMTRRGAVVASALNVRKRPGLAADIDGSLPRGSRVELIGTSGDWYAVDHRRHVRFVHQDWVLLSPSR